MECDGFMAAYMRQITYTSFMIIVKVNNGNIEEIYVISKKCKISKRYDAIKTFVVLLG